MRDASGDQLAVDGELRRCPDSLNGYKYHVNLIVADLGAMNAILGMDFLMAYVVVINLQTDQVSLRSWTLVNTLQGDCSDHIKVHQR